MSTYQETNVRTTSTWEDMRVWHTTKAHTSGGRRGGESCSDDGRSEDFVLVAGPKVTNQFCEENSHVAQ